MALVALLAGAVVLAVGTFAAFVQLRRSGTELASSQSGEPRVHYPERGAVGAPQEPDKVVAPPNGVLVVRQDDFELRGVYLRGGIRHEGDGTLTIRDSVIEGGHGWDRHVQGGTIHIADSTVRSVDGFVPSSVGAVNGHSVTARRNDISGAVDGFHVRSGSVLEENWVHDLRAGSDGHIDAVQLFDAHGIVVRNNRFELYPAGHDEHLQESLHNASIWIAPWQGGWTVSDVTIEGNYLYGGVFTLKTDTVIAPDVSVSDIRVTDNVFGPHPSSGGYAAYRGFDPIVEFSGNLAGDSEGEPLSPEKPVPRPRPLP